jgi:hypothetical protein
VRVFQNNATAKTSNSAPVIESLNFTASGSRVAFDAY